MKIWQRLIQAIGLTSLLLSLWGYYWLIALGWREFRRPVFDPQAPLFRAAFFTMNAIDAALLAGMVLATFRLLRVDLKAVAIYTWLMLGIIVYKLGLGVLWLLPAPLGRSIAAATGIGSMGVGLLLMYPIPFAYPLISVMIVNLARHKLAAQKSTVPTASL